MPRKQSKAFARISKSFMPPPVSIVVPTFMAITYPVGKFECRIADGSTRQVRPIIFHRGETVFLSGESGNGNVGCEPPLTPTSIYMGGYSIDADAALAAYFYCAGARSGDYFTFRNTGGNRLHVELRGSLSGYPTPLISVDIEDDREYEIPIDLQ